MPDIFDEKAPPPPLSSVHPKLANPRVSLPNPNREGSSFLTLTEKAPPAPLQRKRPLKGAKDEQHLRILRESNPLGQAERTCSQAELTCSLRS